MAATQFVGNTSVTMDLFVILLTISRTDSSTHGRHQPGQLADYNNHPTATFSPKWISKVEIPDPFKTLGGHPCNDLPVTRTLNPLFSSSNCIISAIPEPGSELFALLTDFQ